MSLVLIKQPKRLQYDSLRYAYPETWKTLIRAFDASEASLPKQAVGQRVGDSLTADDLLEMSQEALLKHLQKRTEVRLQGVRVAQSQSLGMSRCSSAPTAFATAGAGAVPEELRRQSLSKSKARSTLGGLYCKDFQLDKIVTVHAGGRPVPLEDTATSASTSDGLRELRRELAEEKKWCHQYRLKKKLPRKPDGGLFED